MDLSPKVLELLGQVSDTLRADIGEHTVRWVPVENIHLTLKFLGDVSLSNVERLEEIIRSAVAGQREFAVSVGSVGAFPSPQRARVLWAGVEGPSELFSVQRVVDVETARLGYVSEARPFKPHLTLGRVSRNATSKDIQRIAQVLKDSKVGFLGMSGIKKLHLFRSDLRPHGALYTKLCSSSFMEKPNL